MKKPRPSPRRPALLLLLGASALASLTGCSTTAFERQVRLAERDSVAMQYHVGMVYGSGAAGASIEGAPQERDMQKSVYWLRRAADAGDGRACLALGLCYYYHDGVLRDYTNFETAFELFRLAEEKGVSDANLWLGECYLKGRGTAQDEARAIDCFRKGAEAPGETARYCMANIAACYLFGYGVGMNRDYAECCKWYRRAAENGDAQSQYYLDHDILTMEYFEKIGRRNERDDATRSSGYRVLKRWREGDTTYVKAKADDNADAEAAAERLRKKLLADCENELMLRERSLERDEVGWNVDCEISGQDLACSVTWIYMKVVSHDYDPDSHEGSLTIQLGGKGYADARDYLVENIDAICSTKLVAIRDSSIPEGSKFKCGKDTRNPDGTVTVHFKALN